MTKKKQVTNKHGWDFVKYMACKNDLKGRDGDQWQTCKHRFFVMLTTISDLFRIVKVYKKCNPIKMGFIEYIVLMIAKGYMPLLL